jgi:predicted RNase H-like HicB family nuclease
MLDFSTAIPQSLRITFTAQAVRQGNVGFIAFIEEVPALMAWGSSRQEAEWNLKRRFAAYVALERKVGNLRGELAVVWL